MNGKELEQAKKVLKEMLPDYLYRQNGKERKCAKYKGLQTALECLEKYGEMEADVKLLELYLSNTRKDVLNLQADLARLKEGLPTREEIEQLTLGDFARSYTNSQVIAYQMGVTKTAQAIYNRLHKERTDE